MDGLDFLGMSVAAVLGFLAGATVMYIGPILIEAIDREEETT